MGSKATNTATTSNTPANPAPQGNGNNSLVPAAPATAPWAGKYTTATAKLGGHAVLPAFKYSQHVLRCNTAQGTAPQKPTSVMGKVYGMVAAAGSAGITGNALLAAMVAANWQGHPTRYTTGGMVCPLWCVGYINGALGNKLRHLVASAPKA